MLSIHLFVHPSIRISILSEFFQYLLLKHSRKLGVHISWRVTISFFKGKFVFCLEASNSPQFEPKVWFFKLFINLFIIRPLNYQTVLWIQSCSFIRPFICSVNVCLFSKCTIFSCNLSTFVFLVIYFLDPLVLVQKGSYKFSTIHPSARLSL